MTALRLLAENGLLYARLMGRDPLPALVGQDGKKAKTVGELLAMAKRTDIRDGALWIVQNKTGARLGIEITGELAAVIDRINARPRQAISAHLIQDETGQPLSMFALRSRFDKARVAAKVSFQFRDIRAKAATDTGDLAHSQKLLAHKNRDMTEHYVRSRYGERVKPLR